MSFEDAASINSFHIGHTLKCKVAPGTMSLDLIYELSSKSPVQEYKKVKG